MNAPLICPRAALDGYLQARYLTAEQLSAASGLPVARLDDLVAAGCMPGPSYEIHAAETIHAFVNDVATTVVERPMARWFARDLVPWLAALAPRLTTTSPQALVPEIAATLKADFRTGLARHARGEAAFDGVIDRAGEIDEARLDAHFAEHVLVHWRRGTWGICVYDSHRMENVARKTLAVVRLRRLTEDGRKSAYTAPEATAVRAAIAEYDAIVPPFSPHDHHESSRAQLGEAALAVLNQEQSD